MAYYIAKDGKTVLTWTCHPEGIILETGEVVKEGVYNRRAFATHPDENPKIFKNLEGVYLYKNVFNEMESMKEGGEA